PGGGNHIGPRCRELFTQAPADTGRGTANQCRTASHIEGNSVHSQCLTLGWSELLFANRPCAAAPGAGRHNTGASAAAMSPAALLDTGDNNARMALVLPIDVDQYRC